MRWSNSRREKKSVLCQVNRPLFDKTTFLRYKVLCLFLQSLDMGWTHERVKDLENQLICRMEWNRTKLWKSIMILIKKRIEALSCCLISSQRYQRTLAERTLSLSAIRRDYDERMKNSPKYLKIISRGISSLSNKNRKWLRQESKLRDKRTSVRFKRW